MSAEHVVRRFLTASEGLTVHITSKKSITVASLKAARDAVQAHWGKKTSVSFYRDAKAGIIEKDGKPFAYVAYNGRVFEGVNRMGTGAKELPV